MGIPHVRWSRGEAPQGGNSHACDSCGYKLFRQGQAVSAFATLPSGGTPGPKRELPDRLQGDRGYDSEPLPVVLRWLGITRCWPNEIPSTAAG